MIEESDSNDFEEVRPSVKFDWKGPVVKRPIVPTVAPQSKTMYEEDVKQMLETVNEGRKNSDKLGIAQFQGIKFSKQKSRRM